MANTLANLARMYTETTGTGTLTLTTAVPGFNTFEDAGVTTGATITYAIYCGPHREIGTGVYTEAGLTLTRGTVYSSTNAGAKINLTGRSEVFITAAKEDFDTFLTTAAAAGAYQPLDADLTTLAANITAFGHSLVDDADNTAARTTLGLGTAAVKDTGTSGNTVPLLDQQNTFSASQIVQVSASFGLPMQFISTAADNFGGPFLYLWRNSASPAANDVGPNISMRMQDDAGNQEEMASITLTLLDPTNTAESGRLELITKSSGTAAARVTIQAGTQFGFPTGGDKGAGTLNAVTLYENGTSLAAKYQGLDSELTAIAGLTSAADRLPYFTGSGTASLATFTTAGRNLVDDADASAQRTTLGLGTAAVANTGTSGANLPFLNTANTWSAAQTINSSGGAELRVDSTTAGVVNINMVLSEDSATAGPYISVTRFSTTPASSDQLGVFSFRGRNLTPASVNYAGILAQIVSPTSGSDEGLFAFSTRVAALEANRLAVGRGLYTWGVTGGDQGTGTINATTLYEGGTSLAAKYGAIASANVFTAAQTVRIDSAATSTVTVAATLSSTSTGTPAAGIGVALNFEAETAAGNNEIGARIGAVATDVTSTSEDFDIVFSAMAAGAAVAERGRITSKGTYKYPSFTVAGLPAGTAGETAFASNGRKNGEGAGVGTGVLVFHDGTAWRACDTGATVAA